jgi:hypothetical protein
LKAGGSGAIDLERFTAGIEQGADTDFTAGAGSLLGLSQCGIPHGKRDGLGAKPRDRRDEANQQSEHDRSGQSSRKISFVCHVFAFRKVLRERFRLVIG